MERSHRRVKVIAARKRCLILEEVHLYIVIPRDGKTMAEVPASGLYSYEARDCVQQIKEEAQEQHSCDAALKRGDKYSEGDPVWIKNRGERCTSTSQPGVVTRVISPQVVESDGVVRHVRDLMHRNFDPPDGSSRSEAHEAYDDLVLCILVQTQRQQRRHNPQAHSGWAVHPEPYPVAAAQESVLSRSTRIRQPMQRLCCDLEDQGGV